MYSLLAFQFATYAFQDGTFNNTADSIVISGRIDIMMEFIFLLFISFLFFIRCIIYGFR